jgi:hypothetical protein
MKLRGGRRKMLRRLIEDGPLIYTYAYIYINTSYFYIYIIIYIYIYIYIHIYIDEAKRGAEEDVKETHRRWAANEWASARKFFIESLGHRSQNW